MATAIPLFEVLVACAALLLFIILTRSKRRHPLFPPGPPGLPLLGNVAQLGKYPFLQLVKWREKYGKIYSIKLGFDDCVVVNDPVLIKELFNNVATGGRPYNAVLEALTEGKYGIINTEGERWDEMRKFVIRKLREMGFAKSSMEGMILEEAEYMVEWFSKHKDEAITCNRIFNIAVVNSLWCIVSGERNGCKGSAEEEKSGIVNVSNAILESVQRATNTGLMFAPFLRHIAPGLTGWTSLMKAVKDFSQFSTKSIARHKENLNVDSPNDLIDHMLIEIKNTTNPNSSFFESEGEKNLKANILDLFEAGSETTSATLTWAFLYLAHHPKIQRKLIDEIHTVVGKNRSPSLEDKNSMPYTEAVIMEVLRKPALIPLGGLRKMMDDLTFHGYFLPKGTSLLANIYYSLHDPEIWGDPENFRPERFLIDDEAKLKTLKEALLAFSAGRRQCLGESLARDTLFLFMACIFQKFEVLPDPENPKPDFDPTPGFLNFAKPFKVVMKELV